MAQQKPPSVRAEDSPQGDAWNAFGYLVSGVLVYGLIGWALDRWLDTSFLVVIGILFGAVLGIFMTWRRFAPPSISPPDQPQQRRSSSTR